VSPEIADLHTKCVESINYFMEVFTIDSILFRHPNSSV